MTYLNLTAGLEFRKRNNWHTYTANYVRLQSTLLEQKHYDAFVLSIPADMLMRMALGEDVFVMDASRHSRGSRACWQGLAFLKFVCGRLWGYRVEVNSKYYQDFEERWRKLGKRAKAWVRYYRRVWVKKGKVDVRLRWECLEIERERRIEELV